MDMPRLIMNQQQALIGIQVQQGYDEIRQPQAEVRVQTTQNQLQVDRPARASVEIDQEPGFGYLGVGSHAEWSNNIYSQMNAVLMQGILRRAEDGNKMVETMMTKQDHLGEIAEKNSKLINSVDYSVPTNEMDGMRMNGQFTPADIHFRGASIRFDVTVNKPIVEYHPYKVDLYVRQKNMVQYSVEHSKEYRV